MANDYTQLGSAIGLGVRNPNEQDRTPQMLQNFTALKMRQREQKQKDLATLEDFKIDYSKWIPMYGKAAAEIKMDLVNKFHQYQKENPQTANNRIELDRVAAEQKIGELFASNNQAKEYVTLDPKYYSEDEIKKTLLNPKGTLSDLNTLTNKYKGKGVLTDASGLFSYTPVEKVEPDFSWKAEDYSNTPVNESLIPADVKARFSGVKPPPMTTRYYTQGYVDEARFEGRVDSNARKFKEREDALYNISDEIKFSGDNAAIEKAIRDKIREKAPLSGRYGGFDYKDDPTPSPPQAEKIGLGNLNDRITISRDTGVTFINPKYSEEAKTATSNLAKDKGALVPRKYIAQFDWVDRFDLIDVGDNKTRTLNFNNGIDESGEKISGGFTGAIEGVGHGIVGGKEGDWAIVKVPEKKEASVSISKSTTDAEGVRTTTSQSKPKESSEKIVFVPYSELKGTIKNFTAPRKAGSPYEIRAMFTGGANVVPKSTQTGTAAKGTKSNVTGGQSATEIKSYTRDELKTMSAAYTDEVIDAAVKSGKIQLKAVEQKAAPKKETVKGAMQFSFNDDTPVDQRITTLKAAFEDGDPEVYITDKDKKNPHQFEVYLNKDVGKYKKGQTIKIYN